MISMTITFMNFFATAQTLPDPISLISYGNCKPYSVLVIGSMSKSLKLSIDMVDTNPFIDEKPLLCQLPLFVTPTSTILSLVGSIEDLSRKS